MKQLCLKQKWLYPTDSIVRLFPRNDEARRLLEKESRHWTVRPLPQDTNDIERHLLLKGWIVVRSMIGTTEADDRWVHVSKDNNFYVLLYQDAEPYHYGIFPTNLLRRKRI